MKHKFLINKAMTILLTLMVLLSIVAPAMAWEDKAAQSGKVSIEFSEAEGPTDPAELEAFLDDLFARKMDEYHIAGAAISVAKDGKLFFALHVVIQQGGLPVFEENIPYVASFGAVSEDRPLVYLNSMLEVGLALNLRDFAARYGVKPGATVELAPPR